jgi:cobalt-zinc-cadmium efflux system outer membrane protein
MARFAGGDVPEHGGVSVKIPGTPRKLLLGLLGCASLAGCHGLVKDPGPAPFPFEAAAIDGSGHPRSVPGEAPAAPTDPAVRVASGSESGGNSGPTELGPGEGTTPPPVPPSGAQDNRRSARPEPGSVRGLVGEGGPSGPEPAGAEAGLITLDELQRMAAAANPTLRQALALLEQARGNWLQVGLYPNPTVEAQRAANNAAFDMFNVFITQEIVTGGKLRLNREVAARDVERAWLEAEAQRLRVANEVEIRYVAALGAQRQVAVAEGLLEIAREGVETSEKLLAGEEVSQADVLQARLQRSQTQILLRNARYRADAAWKQLGNVVGQPDLPARQLAGRLEAEIPELGFEAALHQVLGRNPSLQAARARMLAARNQVLREEKQPIPNLDLTAGLGRDFYVPEYMMYTLQIGFNLPVFDRNQGNVAAASGELRAARSEVDRLELSLRNDLAESFRRYQEARNQTQMYRDVVLPASEANLSLSLKRYEEGEFDFLRVLTARHDLFDANVSYVTALTELRIAAIKIQGLLLTGGLDPLDPDPIPANQAGQTNGPGS